MLEKLDKKGFVFLDNSNRPYRCAMWGNEPWLFYWHPDKKWVSLRTVSQFEVWTFQSHELPKEQQEMYLKEDRVW